MAISVTNLGTASDTLNPTVPFTVPVGGVPTGALICGGVCERSVLGGPAGAVTDTAGNTYLAPVGANLNANTASGFGRIFYTYNAIALVSGNTITYTKGTTAVSAAVALFYATGIVTASDPIDSAATASSTGNTATPTVTSGVPATANCLFVGVMAKRGGSTFTQDSTNGAWATPPVDIQTGTGATDARVAGGTLVVADGLAHTYAPTLGTAHVNCDLIVAFKPASSDTLFAQACF